jgi:ABC-type uncharacterized transport system ATPase subunit
VLAVADRITVLRRGKSVTTVDVRETDRHALARLMVGRELAAFVEETEAGSREVLAPYPPDPLSPNVGGGVGVGPKDSHLSSPVVAALSLRNVSALGDKGVPALVSVDLRVASGEILGIAGVAGNGQRELAEVVTGLRRVTGGTIEVGTREITNASVASIAAQGVAHVPEDRLADGLIPGLDLAENAILRDYLRPPISRGSFLVPKAIADFADRLIREYDVKAPGRRTRLRLLSGGNQQKLLLARELSGEPKVIVAVHPTRGVDVGATETIHRLLREQQQRGAAILLISEDLDELLALSDRIAVLSSGRVMGTVPVADADLAQLGMWMAGIQQEAATTHG